MNKTKEGIEVTSGQVWRDLDRRSGNKLCKVHLVLDGRAHMKRCNADGEVLSERVTKVSVKRMHKHSTGWLLVHDVSTDKCS